MAALRAGLLALLAAAAAGEVSPEALAADDSCAAADGVSCGLHALQRTATERTIEKGSRTMELSYLGDFMDAVVEESQQEVAEARAAGEPDMSEGKEAATATTTPEAGPDDAIKAVRETLNDPGATDTDLVQAVHRAAQQANLTVEDVAEALQSGVEGGNISTNELRKVAAAVEEIATNPIKAVEANLPEPTIQAAGEAIHEVVAQVLGENVSEPVNETEEAVVAAQLRAGLVVKRDRAEAEAAELGSPVDETRREAVAQAVQGAFNNSEITEAGLAEVAEHTMEEGNMTASEFAEALADGVKEGSITPQELDKVATAVADIAREAAQPATEDTAFDAQAKATAPVVNVSDALAGALQEAAEEINTTAATTS